jgi:hypothetical protein
MVAAMRFFLEPSAERTGMSAAARAGFEAHWREDRVMAQWGAALARAAHAGGRAELARMFEAGAFENGMAMA